MNQAWNQRQQAEKEVNQNTDESMVYDLVNNLKDKVLDVLEKEVARARIQAFQDALYEYFDGLHKEREEVLAEVLKQQIKTAKDQLDGLKEELKTADEDKTEWETTDERLRGERTAMDADDS